MLGSPDKLPSLQTQTNDILVRAAIDRLRTVFPNDIPNHQDLEEEILGEVVEQVVANFEMLQEENKLLLKERQFYYDRDIKAICKQNDDLQADNQRLQEQLKQLKQLDLQRVRELEKQITEKSHKEQMKIMGLVDENNDLLQRINGITSENKHLAKELQRV